MSCIQNIREHQQTSVNKMTKPFHGEMYSENRNQHMAVPSYGGSCNLFKIYSRNRNFTFIKFSSSCIMKGFRSQEYILNIDKLISTNIEKSYALKIFSESHRKLIYSDYQAIVLCKMYCNQMKQSESKILFHQLFKIISSKCK